MCAVLENWKWGIKNECPFAVNTEPNECRKRSKLIASTCHIHIYLHSLLLFNVRRWHPNGILKFENLIILYMYYLAINEIHLRDARCGLCISAEWTMRWNMEHFISKFIWRRHGDNCTTHLLFSILLVPCDRGILFVWNFLRHSISSGEYMQRIVKGRHIHIRKHRRQTLFEAAGWTPKGK